MWSDAGKRYRTEIADIYSAENKLKLQLHVEAELAQVLAELKIITQKEADQIKAARDDVNIERVKEIEADIHHDLMAVVKALAEKAGKAGEKVHLGATSNDIQDTVLGLQLVQSKKLILDQLDRLTDVLYSHARTYQDLPCIARTHGQHAVPTTVGFKFANFLHELHLAKEMIHQARVNFAKFSGAVGNYASTNRMDIELQLLPRLGLDPLPISTQVVPRGIHANFMNGLAITSSVIERLSKEIRNLQRSEIQEWFEPFSSNQVGSSAMPHKRNPHKSERISGLSRIVRQNVAVAYENIALEHERDISHSSVERIIIPESCNIMLYITKQMTSIMEGLEINKEGINHNLQKAAGKAKSEQILSQLVESVGRQQGHELLRKHIQSSNYAQSVLEDEEITKVISKEELSKIFSDINTGLATKKVKQICQMYETLWQNYRNKSVQLGSV